MSWIPQLRRKSTIKHFNKEHKEQGQIQEITLKGFSFSSLFVVLLVLLVAVHERDDEDRDVIS